VGRVEAWPHVYSQSQHGATSMLRKLIAWSIPAGKVS
jgi:hypothetical protein